MNLQKLMLSKCLAPSDNFLGDSITAFSTLKSVGNLGITGTDPLAGVHLNNLLRRLDLISRQLVIMKPQHGDSMLSVNTNYLQENHPAIFNVDALICGEPKIALGLASADCLPVFFSDFKKKIIALTHAGRAGLELNIVFKTLERLLIAGCDIKNLKIYIGPGIGSCCYRFAVSRFDFPKNNWRNNLGVWQHNSVDYNDPNTILHEIGLCLKGQVLAQIKNFCLVNKISTRPEIQASEYCTCCTTDIDDKSLFFSHVRSRKNNEPEGRFLSLIMLE